MIRVSNRLEVLSGLIPTGSVLCDIGTDHGYLIALALKKNLVSFAYGIDINAAPLELAQRTMLEQKLDSSQYQLILSDGLHKFDGDANCFVMAGMGCETICQIIGGYEFKDSDTLIIQANTKWPLMRTYLNEHGFKIVQEKFLFDQEKPYLFIKCVLGKQEMTLENSYLGYELMEFPVADYMQHLKERHAHLKAIAHHKDALETEYKILYNYLKEKEADYEFTQ